MKNEKFEHLLSTIRNEKVDDKIVAEARDRVWKSITEAGPAVQATPHTLRTSPPSARAYSAELRRLPVSDSRLRGEAVSTRPGHAV